ncbi:MAG: hypothetical protein M3454_01090 [Actinomycetota bacterium]|nr:hypothetical protein [Actinomycetota bacterium]
MRLPLSRVAAVGWLLFVFAACGEGGPSPTSEKDTEDVENAGQSTGKDLGLATHKDFDPANFDEPTEIDNEWFPLKPGTQFVLKGSVTDDGRRIPHRVVFTVTDFTKVINGIRTVVLWDRDYTEGELVEEELAFHAQDNDGNVWNMGEYPEEYEEGRFAGAPDVWLSGTGDARAGVLMRSEPRQDTPSYWQGLSVSIEFADRAKILETGRKTCVPADCYDNVLVIQEWDPAEPGAFQQKYYASGVGNVRVGWAGPNEDEKETLVLTEIRQLDASALGDVREEALRLEERAYRISKRIYAGTSPLEH